MFPKYPIIAVLFLIIGLFGIYRLFHKADLPFEYDSNLVCKYDYGDIHRGDIIQKLNGIALNSGFQLELILDSKSIGDNVELTLLSDHDLRGVSRSNPINETKNLFVQLTLAGGKFFIYLSLILGLAFWLSSIFVIMKKPGAKSARILFWIFIAFSVAIMTPSPPYLGGSDIPGYFLRIFHYLSYLLGTILFVHFTFIFPYEKIRNKKTAFTLIYLPPAVISLLLSLSIIFALGNFLSEWVNIYDGLWTITELYILLGILFSTVNLFFSYRKLNSPEDKRKVEWIFWGIAVGVMPFLILFVAYDILHLPKLLNEEIPLTFLIFIPISFIIAVLKYQLFDIEFIIKRSINYTFLTAVVLILYFGLLDIIQIVSRGVLGEDNRIVSLIITFFIALLFNPMRVKVKELVDKKFYRVKYNLNNALRNFSNELKNCNTLNEVGNVIINEIQKLIPVSKIAIAISDEYIQRLKILSHYNFDELSHSIAALRIKKIETNYNLPFALNDKVEPGIEVNSSLDVVLKRWDISLAIPLVLESKEIVGVIMLGKKLSGMRYFVTDIELLNIIAVETAFAIKRLQLREKLLFEGIEKARLEELNNLKSFFVSRVSHDLKTPLTSIKMFAEILRSKNRIGAGKKSEYLKIIEGESLRLTRFIDNVLDYAKIEKGIKEYNFGDVNLNKLIKDVLKSLQYEIKIQKFNVNIEYSKENCIILADSEAVREAIMNIILNAMKYSKQKKNICVASFLQNGYVGIKISDEGRGIPEDSLKIIFDPFYRSKDAFFNRVKGTGLGLAIVKHIMNAHKGKIDVESEPGKGSIFTLLFPQAL